VPLKPSRLDSRVSPNESTPGKEFKREMTIRTLPAGRVRAITLNFSSLQPTGGPSQLGASDAPIVPFVPAVAVPRGAQDHCRKRGR